MIKKKLEELNLLDDFLFGAMVAYPELGEQFSRKVLEIILQRKLGKLKVVPQKVYPGSDSDLHGARLDVYLEENCLENIEAEAMSIYDIEPDKNEKAKAVAALPKRIRFYHSKIDAKGLKAGKSYQSLKNVVIIMILPYDPFGLGRMVYTVQNGCREEPDMPYDDGARTLFLYTRGKKNIPSEELRQLLAYFEHSTEKYAINNDLREIHEMVSRVRQDEEVELSYMKIFEREQMIWEDGMDIGRNEGEELKLIQQVLKKVHKGKDMYTIAEELEEVPADIERLYETVKNNQDRTKEEIHEIYFAGRREP